MSDAQGPNESALAAAIQRVTADTRGLVQDQVDLAKVELQQKAAVFGRGTVIAVAAGVFLVGALLLIIEGASLVLALPRANILLGLLPGRLPTDRLRDNRRPGRRQVAEEGEGADP